MTRNYQWLGVIRDVERYIEGYDIYQRMKNKTEISAGKLKLSEFSEKPWTYLIVDFITKLLLVAREDMILVVCDMLSKIMYFVATTKKTSAE